MHVFAAWLGPFAASMERIRILLANHHPIIRSSLRLLLERECEFQVVGEAANGREAFILTEFRRPDVVLLDIQFPDQNGITAAREISASKTGCKIVFVSVDTDQSYLSEAFKAGAHAYVLGDAAPTDLVRAVHVVAAGRRFLSPTITAQVIQQQYARTPSGNAELSDDHRQLCCLLAAGYNGNEIAANLNLDFTTMKAECHAVNNTLLRTDFPNVVTDLVRESQDRFLNA